MKKPKFKIGDHVRRKDRLRNHGIVTNVFAKFDLVVVKWANECPSTSHSYFPVALELENNGLLVLRQVYQRKQRRRNNGTKD